jgi:hypothetical protein
VIFVGNHKIETCTPAGLQSLRLRVCRWSGMRGEGVSKWVVGQKSRRSSRCHWAHLIVDMRSLAPLSIAPQSRASEVPPLPAQKQPSPPTSFPQAYNTLALAAGGVIMTVQPFRLWYFPSTAEWPSWLLGSEGVSTDGATPLVAAKCGTKACAQWCAATASRTTKQQVCGGTRMAFGMAGLILCWCRGRGKRGHGIRSWAL